MYIHVFMYCVHVFMHFVNGRGVGCLPFGFVPGGGALAAIGVDERCENNFTCVKRIYVYIYMYLCTCVYAFRL